MKRLKSAKKGKRSLRKILIESITWREDLDRDYFLNDRDHYFEKFYHVYICRLDHHHHRLQRNIRIRVEHLHLVNINPLED